jgi:hypothetical protein
MVHRSFWFYILDKERVGESRDISQSRTAFNISKYRSAIEARSRYTEQGRRVGRVE